jgi:hypothetical protein
VYVQAVPGQAVHFKASGGAVTWQVNNAAGGNAAAGTIDAAGAFTAPAALPSPAGVTVTAVVTLLAAHLSDTTYYVAPGGGAVSIGAYQQ